MNPLEWIICERSGRWATALRNISARQATVFDGTLRLREVRRLSELDACLDDRRYGLALIEVTPANFEEVLIWLSEAGAKRPNVRSIAMLERELSNSWHLEGAPNRHDVPSVILEAGALEIVFSPRNLQHVLAVGRRLALKSRVDLRQRTIHQSFTDWASSMLPWQEA